MEAYHKEIGEKIVHLQVTASYQNMMLDSTTDDLCKLGALDEFTVRIIKSHGKTILDNANKALTAQSDAIDPNHVLGLLG